MEGESEGSPVPHLHRVSPDGRWLASYDADDARVFLTPIAEGMSRASRTLKLTGVMGQVRQFRWLESDSLLAIATDSDVFLAPIPSALLQGGDEVEVEVEADSVFSFEGGKDGGRQIIDLRLAPGGFFVRVGAEGDFHWFRQQVYFARVSDGTLQELDPLVPDGLTAQSASLAFDGELAITLEYWDDERFGEGPGPLVDEGGEVWRFALSEEGEPQRVGRLACPEDYCQMSNWAPNSSPLVAVHGYGEIAVFDKDSSERPPTFDFDADGAAIDSLWAWPEGGWVAADGEFVRSFDDEGTLLWSWSAPRDKPIHGVHLDEGGQTVMVTAGLDVYRVRAGKGRRLLRSRGAHAESGQDRDDWGGMSESFVDQALALPGGAIAYTVVDLETGFGEPDWREPELLPPELVAPEMDPFSESTLPPTPPPVGPS
jgi:hypothetical protein